MQSGPRVYRAHSEVEKEVADGALKRIDIPRGFWDMYSLQKLNLQLEIQVGIIKNKMSQRITGDEVFSIFCWILTISGTSPARL